jgi:thioredoxin reductase (NADPH)
MFTRNELRSIPLFSELDDVNLDYLAKTSADLRLLSGEYVVHEGQTRRALFILVDGRVEVTKLIGSAERVMGARGPGESFGELPFVLNTPYAVNFRAVSDSRVMSIEPKDFYVIASSAPKMSAAIDALAMERVGGLQDLAAEPQPPRISVTGPQFDSATYELREFLQRNSVEYDSIVTEDGGRYPEVRLEDGTLLKDPSIRELAGAIGLSVAPRKQQPYDVAIIGGGPSGLAAALYAASEGLSTILLEKEAPGGQAGTSSRIENYLGFPYGISGDDLAHRALEQAKRLGADIVVTRNVERIDPGTRTIMLDGSEAVDATAIVVASGVSWRQLDVASLDRLRGRGVYYGAAPGEVKSVQGGDVYLIGGGNSAGQAAVNLSNFAREVTLLVRGDSLGKSMSHYLIEQLRTKPNIRVETNAKVLDGIGEDHLEGIVIADTATGQITQRRTSALFILIGADAETAWLPAEVRRDERGFVLTGSEVRALGTWPVPRDPYLLETAVPGIFAVGDVRAGSIKRVAAAVGEGSMAIAFVHRYLTDVALSSTA